MYKVNLLKTSPKEKAFLAMVRDRIEGLGYSRKEQRELKVKALQEFRKDNSGRMDRLAKGLALNIDRYLTDQEQRMVPEAGEVKQ